MAKAPLNDDAPVKKRRGTSVMAWVLMAMLIGGLGGFGVTNFGAGVTSIGQVGDRDIDVNEYATALRQEINALSAQYGQPISLAQLQTSGVDKQVLQGVITRSALDGEADQIGVSVGDEVVAGKVAATPAFQGTAGSFDRETYRMTLNQYNLTEAAYESSLRRDAARSLIQGAVVGGFTAPDALTDTIAAYVGEQRGYTMLRLTEADLPAPLSEATEVGLTAYYTTNIAAFTRPEAKRITYVSLLPDALAKDMPVDEQKLKDLYQSKIDTYVIPEKRLVERLVYPTEAEAVAAKAKLDAGTAFETLVAERKLALEDIDIGDVSKAELGAAGDAVFALAGPGVVGPFQSSLGPALFRMNAVLAAQETTFDQARVDLAAEMQQDAARRAITDKIEAIDDLLAGGATLEELAKEQGMVLATTDYAEGADDNDAIAGYTDFREAAAKLAQADFAEAVILDDGGVVAMRLDEIVPPTPVPFAQVREKVAVAAKADAVTKALSDYAVVIKSGVEGGASLGAYGIASRTAATDRQGFVEGAPETLMKGLFEMAVGDVRVIEGAGFTAVVALDNIAPAPTAGEDAITMREVIATQAAQGIAGDAFTLFTNALTTSAGITLNQSAIDAVHSQFGQ